MQFKWAATVTVFIFVTVTVQLQPLLTPLPLSHKAHAEMSYAGTVRDEDCRERWGKKGEEGGNPRVELALEVKFLLHEMQDIPFSSDFMW